MSGCFRWLCPATLLLCSLSLHAERVCGEDTADLPSISEHTAGMSRHGGFFPIYWDESSAKLFLQIDVWDQDFLMLTGLNSGLGSNPVGLDRGQIGDTVVCRWRRVGPKVYLEQQNLKFRADGAAAAERRAVQDSFADSVLWSGDVVAVESGACLADITELVLSDRHAVSNRHGIADALKQAGQGEFSFSKERSFIEADQIEAFPDNVELHARLTFTSHSPGSEARSVAASGSAPTIGQRISLIRLPERGFEKREFDPRVGSFDVSYADYAAPLDRSIFRRWMTRHRLELDEQGRVVRPITYYVDAAAPEPIRSALVEGASWWAEAFSDAGFPGGFVVKVAPADMDPLDVRFNFIQWVHRQTRGWSYGAGVVDPRTGEIIKGHVSLGSLRVRQDRLLLENMTHSSAGNPEAGQCGMALPASYQIIPDLLQDSQSEAVSLARIRQLAAHEVGHTLGIAHNFAASTYGDRASVMDYPAPRLRVNDDGSIDASDAYGVGIGVWDRFTVRCMYAPINKTDSDSDNSELTEWIGQSQTEGLLYMSDADARPAGGAHPLAHLWDNGSDPVEELSHVLKVREAGIRRFSTDVLLRGENSGDLQRAFAPLYLHHRYQSEAVIKRIGGVHYDYTLPGDSRENATPVSSAEQERAVQAILTTLSPEILAVPEEVLPLLVPSFTPSAWNREEQRGYTEPIYDPLAAAESATQMTCELLLHPARLARLQTHGYTVDSHPGISLLLTPLSDQVLDCFQTRDSKLTSATGRVVSGAIINAMLSASDNESAREDVRAELTAALRSIADRLDNWKPQNTADSGLTEAKWFANRIRRHLSRPDLPRESTQPQDVPPGSPIGGR